MAVEDALQETHLPRVDDREHCLYLVLHATRYDQDASPHLETRQLDLFLEVHYLITVHQQPIGVIQKVWSRCLKDERMLKHGAARLLYHLVDALFAETMPAVDAIDDALERLEEAVFAGAQQRLVDEYLWRHRSAGPMASLQIRPNDAGLHGAPAGIDVPMAPPQEMDVALWRGKCTALAANTWRAELLFIERWMEKGASPATAFGPCNDVAWRTGSLVDQALLFICLIVAGSA